MFKKVVCLITLVLMLGLASSASAALVSEWKMDEGSWNGTAGEAKDSQGPNNATGTFDVGFGGTATPTTVAVAAGAHTGSYVGNRAGSFDGNVQFLKANDDPSQWITSDLTMATWFSSDALDPREVMNVGTGGWGYRFRVAGDANGVLTLKLGMRDPDTSSVDWYLSTATFVRTAWTHIAVVADFIDGAGADSNSVSFYVNGTQLGSSVALTQTSIEANAYPLVIGAATDRGHGAFIGLLDDVRLYNNALSGNEVEGLLLVPEPATVALLGLGGLALLRRRKK